MPKPHSDFVLSLLDLLAPLGGVTARRMFGGCGIYKDELMFALVAYDRLYLKADEGAKLKFEEHGQHPFVYEGSNGKKMVMSYWTAPEEALQSPMRMKPWALLAWEAAKRAAIRKPAAKKNKKPRR